eukprot:3872174-Pleurochrysis_carterae.AAC.1
MKVVTCRATWSAPGGLEMLCNARSNYSAAVAMSNMADMPPSQETDAEAVEELDESVMEDIVAVYTLLDESRSANVERNRFVQALIATGLASEAQADNLVQSLGSQEPILDLDAFRSCLIQIVQSTVDQHYQSSASRTTSSVTAVPTLGTALLCARHPPSPTRRIQKRIWLAACRCVPGASQFRLRCPSPFRSAASPTHDDARLVGLSQRRARLPSTRRARAAGLQAGAPRQGDERLTHCEGGDAQAAGHQRQARLGAAGRTGGAHDAGESTRIDACEWRSSLGLKQ